MKSTTIPDVSSITLLAKVVSKKRLWNSRHHPVPQGHGTSWASISIAWYHRFGQHLVTGRTCWTCWMCMFLGCLANQLVIISVVVVLANRLGNIMYLYIYILFIYICIYTYISTLYYIPHIYRTMCVIDICTRSQKVLQQFAASIWWFYQFYLFCSDHVYPQFFSRFIHFEVGQLTSFVHQQFNVFVLETKDR